MAATEARILVVDDDASVRDLLVTAPQRDGWTVRAAADAAGAEAALTDGRFEPDVAVLDIHLGDGPDGLAVARFIRQRGDIPFIFLTDRHGVEDRLAGFESGADDYLAKPFVLAELLARLRVILRRNRGGGLVGGGGPLGSGVLEVGPLKIDEPGRRVFVDGEIVELTRIEFELLINLAAQAGTVVAKADLLGRVWGFEGYDQNLVEVHVSSLRRKLGSQSSVIQTVRGSGYVLRID